MNERDPGLAAVVGDVVENAHVGDAGPCDPGAAAALHVKAVDRDVVGVDADGVK